MRSELRTVMAAARGTLFPRRVTWLTRSRHVVLRGRHLDVASGMDTLRDWELVD